MLYIGIDTSCYTTSIACVNQDGVVADIRMPLVVKPGERGLRQSEGLFQHTKNLAVITKQLFSTVDARNVGGIAVSGKPCDTENSYMPVFLAGRTVATAIASSLSLNLIETTHQQGHIRAALYGVREIKDEFIGMHISGGTTDVFMCDKQLELKCVGKSNDLYAGQLVDRVGVKLGYSFPAGKHLEQLAMKHSGEHLKIPSSVKRLDCSLSGAENMLMRYIDAGEDKENIAYAMYDMLARTFAKQIVNASYEFGIKQAVFLGGVASSQLLRCLLLKRVSKLSGDLDIEFGAPELSSDNAVGVALICRDRCIGEGK